MVVLVIVMVIVLVMIIEVIVVVIIGSSCSPRRDIQKCTSKGI